MNKTFTSISFKAIAISAMLLTPALSNAQSSSEATTIFSEDFGTATSEKDELIEDHEWNTNPKSMFSWTVSSEEDNINVRTNNPSDYEGASGDGNLYFKGVASFTISGINTSGYSDLTLSFGAFGKNKNDVTLMTVEYVADGGESTQLCDFANLELDATKKTWSKASVSGLPEAESLAITFKSNLDVADDGGIRLDDICISGTKNTDGISEIATENTKSFILVSGKTVRNLNTETNALIYDYSGKKVAEIGAGDNANIAKQGFYLVKVGNATTKIAVK